MAALALLAVLLSQDSPLKPLTEIAKHLDKGAAEFMKGAEPAEAWKPWDVKAAKAQELRDALKAAGVKSLSNLGFELEFVFKKKAAGGNLYYLRTFVWASGEEAAFLAFDGREEKELHVQSKPLDAYKDASAPFAAAADALVKIILAKEASKLPFMDAEKLTKLVASEKVRKDAGARLEQSRKNAPAVCAAIVAMETDVVELRIDDQSFLAGDKGMVRAGWELGRDGKLTYNLGGFRGFPK